MINALRLFSNGQQLDFLVLEANGSAAVDRVVSAQGLQWYTFGSSWIHDGTAHSLLIELQSEASLDRVHMWTANAQMTPEQVTIMPVPTSESHALCAPQDAGWPIRPVHTIMGNALARVEVAPLAPATPGILLEFSSAGSELAEELFLLEVQLYSGEAEIPFVVEGMRTASGVSADLRETTKIHRGPFQVTGLPVTLSVRLQRPAQVGTVQVTNIAAQSLVLKVAPLMPCQQRSTVHV